MLRRLYSVSYTHLDVYKRQGKSTALLNMLKKGYDFFADDFVYLKARKIKAIDLPIKSRKTRINSLKVKLVDEFKYILPKPEQAFDSNNYYDLKTIVFPIYDPCLLYTSCLR